MDDALTQLEAHIAVLSRKGKPGKARQAQEQRPTFRENRESARPTEKAGSADSKATKAGTALHSTALEDAKTWTSYGILGHKLLEIGALAA